MKKLLMIILLLILIFFIITTGVFAKSLREHTVQNYLTFSWFLRPASLGLKHNLGSNVYATGNLGFMHSADDLELQAGNRYADI